MSDKLGVSSAFLSAVENGKKRMPEAWHEKLSQIYKLNNEQKQALIQADLESSKQF